MSDGLPDVTVVIPTIGRPSLDTLLASLAGQDDGPARIVVVDDRPSLMPLTVDVTVTVLRSGGRGPAAARNIGWRAATTPWIVFLDDDVVVTPTWSEALADDLADAPHDVGAVQATIVVPRPVNGRISDNERNTVALEQAAWITADLAVRRTMLAEVDGFDERFPRAYREDSDFALRSMAAGWRFTKGRRITQHPLRAAPWWASITAQRGNRDDALMSALHGGNWNKNRGRRRRHGAVTAAGAIAVAAAAVGARRLAALSTLAWAGGTLEFATARVMNGRRSAGEVMAMLATSTVIPPLAIWHWTAGRMRWRPTRTAAWLVATSPSQRDRDARRRDRVDQDGPSSPVRESCRPPTGPL